MDKIYAGIIVLLMRAGTYDRATVAEIRDCIIAAAHHDKMALWWNDRGELSAFMTFAFLPEGKSKQFAEQSYLPTGDDFALNEGDLWIIDFINLDGDMPIKGRQVRKYLADRYGNGIVVKWRRQLRGQFKLGRAVTRNR